MFVAFLYFIYPLFSTYITWHSPVITGTNITPWCVWAQSCYRSSLHLASKHLFESRKRNVYYWLRLNIVDINAMIIIALSNMFSFFVFEGISLFYKLVHGRFDIYQINGHNLHFLPLFWFSSFPFTISLHRKIRDNKRVR